MSLQRPATSSSLPPASPSSSSRRPRSSALSTPQRGPEIDGAVAGVGGRSADGPNLRTPKASLSPSKKPPLKASLPTPSTAAKDFGIMSTTRLLYTQRHPADSLTASGSPLHHQWSSTFDGRCRKPLSKESLHKNAEHLWSVALAAKKVARWLKLNQTSRLKLAPVRRTLSNLKPPGPALSWHGRRTFLCDACLRPCPAAEVKCSSCNVVLHAMCLDPDTLHNVKACGGDYTCDFCDRDEEDDKDWYKSERGILWTREMRNNNARTIGKIARGWLARFRYKRLLKNVTVFQGAIRRHLQSKRFKMLSAARKRPMYVSVVAARDMPVANKDQASADPYVVVTVHEGQHKDQVARFDTEVCYKTLNCDWEKQHFLIPGANANTVLVFTVVDKEENRDQFLGQCCLAIGPNLLWKTGGTLDIDLSELQYVIRDHRGLLSDIAYEKIAPRGSLTVEIKPTNSLYSCCGTIIGPHIEVLMAGLVKISKGRNNLSGSKVSQKMTYWGVICEGELLIFRHFGDKEPRLVVNIDCAMAVSRIKGSASAEQQSGKKSMRRFSLTGKDKEGPEVLEEQLKEFTIRSGEMHRHKFVFATPNKRECRHWVDVLDYYISRSKGEKRRQRISFNGPLAASSIPTKAELLG